MNIVPETVPVADDDYDVVAEPKLEVGRIEGRRDEARRKHGAIAQKSAGLLGVVIVKDVLLSMVLVKDVLRGVVVVQDLLLDHFYSKYSTFLKKSFGDFCDDFHQAVL